MLSSQTILRDPDDLLRFIIGGCNLLNLHNIHYTDDTACNISMKKNEVNIKEDMSEHSSLLFPVSCCSKQRLTV